MLIPLQMLSVLLQQIVVPTGILTHHPPPTAPDAALANAEAVQQHPLLQFAGLLDGSWTTFFVIAVASSRLGTIFTVFRLPLITGYMIVGIICGPYVLNLVTSTQIPDLGYITQVALSFIAFSAGSELYLPELRSLFKTILWMSFYLATVTYSICSIVIYAVAKGGLLPWTKSLSNGCIFAISLIAATIMVARSPASAIAVIRELRAKGPVTSTMLGVTVFGDVIVLVLFTISSSIALALCSTEGNVNGAEFIITLLTLVVAVGLGYCVGGFFIFLLWIKKIPARFTIIPCGFMIFVLCDWFAVYSINTWGVSINFDALLICITAGYVVTNQSTNRTLFLQMLAGAGSYIFIPFFTKVGVELNLKVLFSPQIIGFAFLVWAVRAFCIFVACVLGGTTVGMDKKRKLTIWMTMLAQAGVSLGLAAEVAVKFPVWGPSFQTTIIGVVLINQFAGPVLCKYALKKNEEDGKMGDDEEHEHEHNIGDDIHKRVDDKKKKKKLRKRALFIGVDNVILALAQRLLNNNWDIVLLDEDENKTKLALSALDSAVSLNLSGEDGSTNVLSKVGTIVDQVTDKMVNVVEVGLDKIHKGLVNENDKLLKREAESSEDNNNNVNINVASVTSSDHRVTSSVFNVVESLGASILRTLSSLDLTSESDFDVCVATSDSDEHTRDICIALADSVLRVPKLIGRLHNPAWAPVFAGNGIMPIYGLSTRVNMLKSAIEAEEKATLQLVAASENLPQALASVIHSQDDLNFTLVTMSDKERDEYLSRYPGPAAEDSATIMGQAMDAASTLKNSLLNKVSLFGVVPESLREDYMTRILQIHNPQTAQGLSDKEMAAANDLMISPSVYRMNRNDAADAALLRKPSEPERAASVTKRS